MRVRYFRNAHYVLSTILLILNKINAVDVSKEDVDKIIEDGITKKLGEDLIQSIEKKFQVDLERSLEVVLEKIKLLLQNGTHYIQDRLAELQTTVDNIKSQAPTQAEDCLMEKQNETSALAEKALHQMVICGYALIGQDPSMAINKVLTLKNMINQGMKPIIAQKEEIHGLLKVCGHEYDSLKKVIKCVISKSPKLKSAMMEITGNLVEGIIGLTKLIAHGAMHEACLIEVVKAVEDEAFKLVSVVKKCSNNETIINEMENFIEENNATVLDIPNYETNETTVNKISTDIQDVLRRMLEVNENDVKHDLTDKLIDVL